MATTLQKAVSEFDERLTPASEIEIERALSDYTRALEAREEAVKKVSECEDKESEAIAGIIRLIGPRSFAIKGVVHHVCCSTAGRLYFRVTSLGKGRPRTKPLELPKKQAPRVFMARARH